MFYKEIRIKKHFLSYHSVAFKESLQQQIHFNDITFENECCRWNEGPL